MAQLPPIPRNAERLESKDDFEGLRYVTQHTPIPIAADESATNSAEVMRLLTAGAVNVINIKLQKSGLVDALTIAAICHTTKTPLMVGPMAESCIGTSASAHFAAGVGGFSYIDLDMPMLLLDDPFTGDYEQRGGIYDLSGIESGMGVEKKSKPPDAGA
jgi:L-alanine-DL-glutamate epimerase-like enolase superfamily enzyme